MRPRKNGQMMSFSNAFSWMKIIIFYLNFTELWSQTSKYQYDSIGSYDGLEATSHNLNQYWPSLLMHKCIARPQWVNSSAVLMTKTKKHIFSSKFLWLLMTLITSFWTRGHHSKWLPKSHEISPHFEQYGVIKHMKRGNSGSGRSLSGHTRLFFCHMRLTNVGIWSNGSLEQISVKF